MVDAAVSLHTPIPTERGGGTLDQLKSKVPSPSSFHLGGGGWGTLDATFLKYFSGATQGVLSTKILTA